MKRTGNQTGYGGASRKIALIVLILSLTIPIANAQQTCIRIIKQDSTLNNLVDPPGYKTAKLGTLSNVIRSGTGPQAMILIPGLGFGGDIFNEFMQANSDKCRMWAVTLPGFGGTAAPPCPSESVSFGQQTWTTGALTAIEKLIADEGIQNSIIVGHWLTGTQLALQLALKHPDKIRAVVLLSGALRLYVTDTAYAKYYETPQKRVASTDKYMAPKWFKTVTRETWDDNNFLPGDYAINQVRAMRLWREAAAPLLHVWVRYLCEFNVQDMSSDLKTLKVPTLILEPGLEGLQFDSGGNYMDNYCRLGWKGAIENNPSITVRTIPNSRACLWFDQSLEVNAAVADFLKSVN